MPIPPASAFYFLGLQTRATFVIVLVTNRFGRNTLASGSQIFMEKLMGRHASYYYAFFRIVFGFMFLFHGTQKFFNFPASANWSGAPSGMPFVGGILEIVCGTLIMLGFFTSFAAFLASGMMAVAYFMYHQPGGALPRTNGGELAVAYCFAFLYIASRGSGALSLDSVIRPNKGTTPY